VLLLDLVEREPRALLSYTFLNKSDACAARAGRLVVPGSDQVLDRLFCCDRLAHRDAEQTHSARHAASIARHQEIAQQPAGRRLESGRSRSPLILMRNPEGYNSLEFVLRGVTT